jgi:pyruvate dehydrogenase E2 component (dihydrolipoamide acetyltransferase)
MKYIFNFPDIGEGLDEGIIAEWHVKKGQKIESGEILVSMETDKVVAEIPSPKSGIVAALFGKPGDIIRVGEALIELEIEGSESEIDSTTELIKEEGAGVVGTLEIAGNNAVMRASKEGLVLENISDSKPLKKALATPVARAIAKEMNIEINNISGTGPAGRVMKEDILKYSEKASSPQRQAISQNIVTENLIEIEPLSQIRKTIAKNMLQSKHNAAHMSVFDDVEVSELDRIRKNFKAEFESEEIKLTYLAFIVKATALALKKHKHLNSEMDFEGGKMIYKKFYNIGIAVDTVKGLVVPVIKNADKLSIKEIAAQIQNLSVKASENKLTMDDLKEGTFTITSYGSIGGKYAVPVINYPQAGILGIGRVSKQAVVKNDKIEVGLVMPLSISVDHRIVDGGETTRFLNTIIKYLSEPVTMLME